MAKRHALEAVDRTMKDITGVMLPFGGKIMVLGGDFRQVLPVVRRGTRAQTVDSSIRMSPLWSSIIKLRLTINMRALTDPWFSDFLLRVSDGVEETVHGNFIRIPDDMVIPFTKKEKPLHALIDAIFPSFEINRSEPDYIISHAILSTRNDSVDEINDYLIGRFHGEERNYYSFDEAVDDINNFYPVEFLNTLSVLFFLTCRICFFVRVYESLMVDGIDRHVKVLTLSPLQFYQGERDRLKEQNRMYYHEHWNSSNRLKGARIDNPVSVFMVWSLRGKMDEFTLAICGVVDFISSNATINVDCI
ncbi:unnamed protein product [Lactuca virosa]|uniref:ATP-dependent DNA helicase n=1 Tax=Lactuca virosa TaxID=75947 RepID=A0AAU9MLR2_9ASTR|nr:unnamed protein product [Lactuca virosa]